MRGISFLVAFGAELVVSKFTELDFSRPVVWLKCRPVIKHAKRFVRNVGKRYRVSPG